MAIDEKKLIYAEDAINLIKENWELTEKDFYSHPKAVEFGIGIAIRIIENFAILNGLSLEKFQATKTSDKWIPCSERLPEENGSYIVTSLDYVDTFEAVFDQGEWFSIDYCDDIKNVIAWMPLPEPYKGENDEN